MKAVKQSLLYNIGSFGKTPRQYLNHHYSISQLYVMIVPQPSSWSITLCHLKSWPHPSLWFPSLILQLERRSDRHNCFCIVVWIAWLSNCVVIAAWSEASLIVHIKYEVFHFFWGASFLLAVTNVISSYKLQAHSCSPVHQILTRSGPFIFKEKFRNFQASFEWFWMDSSVGSFIDYFSLLPSNFSKSCRSLKSILRYVTGSFATPYLLIGPISGPLYSRG